MTTIAPEVQTASLPDSLDRVYRTITRNLSDALPAETHLPEAGPCLALERIEYAFQVTPFERDLLLLCAGASLESRFAKACAAIHNDTHATWPTFGLALAMLDDPHWSAISRTRPLRYWKLIEVSPDHTLLDAPLRIDERVLQFLMGVPTSDERLEAMFRPLPSMEGGRRYEDVIYHAARHWSSPQSDKLHPVLLVGGHEGDRQAVFEELCYATGLRPYTLDAAALPASSSDLEPLARLWTREAVLTGAGLYITTASLENTRTLSVLLDSLRTPVAVEAAHGPAVEHIEGVRVHVPTLDASGRKALWAESLGPLAAQMNGQVDRLAEYFQFDEQSIRASAIHARNANDPDPAKATWRICREHARRSLDLLATRIEPRAKWQDLVLPATQMETLRQLTTHVQQRAVVHEAWGFADKHARGLGLSVLFAGASGTGKTMAAEVLAGELDLDLYQIDLSAVVSKYIGETEKNLRRIFMAAEKSGSVLLFDEADALFGKRSEVRDSHDRYANLEISYLLQQMESYRGIAILTTNMQHALDPAFLRRIRFLVQFPFPDATARRQIWERIFPAATPAGTLSFDQLAQLNVSGGTIRNIAIHAAFLAAGDSSPVEMRHLLAAVRTEYQKMEKPLTTAETRGWA
jgi:hypothetical protein